MQKISLSVLFVGLAAFMMACSPKPSGEGSSTKAKTVSLTSQGKSDGLSRAYFASGCFWCVEAVFESVKGVDEAISGYSGGKEANPTYQQVSASLTSHAEAVEVIYDSSIVDFPTLVKVYYGSHDPTTANRQGPDRGPQYRSIAFYENATEKKIIEDYIKKLESGPNYGKGDIVTEVTRFEKFWVAEDYHQDFERRNPTQRYVMAVSVPRLNRFKAKFPELLKDEAH